MIHLFFTISIGVGATIVMDLWGLIRARLFRSHKPDYRLLGRWIAHMFTGRFFHQSIADTRAVDGEAFIGWAAHYAIGIVFAGMLVAACGTDWCRDPSMGPALGVGLATVLAPFLIMQPGMGAGLAARRTANPTAARLQSLVTHLVFGLGLYMAAWIVSPLAP